MKTTGQLLKDAREKKNISINEVALATKINAKALLAMESGDPDGLPPRTFLRGFVRAYAGFLGLDVQQILSVYQEEMGGAKPRGEGDSPAPTLSKTEPRAKAPLGLDARGVSPAKIGGVIVVLILIGLIVLFKKKMDSYESETVKATGAAQADSASARHAGVTPPSPLPNEIPQPIGSATPAPLPAATAAPAPTPEATPMPTRSPTPAATPAPTPTPTPSPSPSPTPATDSATAPAPITPAAPSPTPTPTPSPSPSPTPVAKPSPTPKPTPRPTPVGRPQEVLIEALDGVDVDATIDGEAPRKFKMRGQEVQTIKAKRRVTLKFSDGGAVNIVVNGKDRGVPGDLGKPMRVDLP